MMIGLFGMLLAFQAAVAVPQSDRDNFEGYRQCVLGEAKKAVPSESAASIWARATQACKVDLTASRLAMEADDLAMRAEDMTGDKPDPANASTAGTTDQRAAVMQKELAAEVAALRTNATQ